MKKHPEIKHLKHCVYDTCTCVYNTTVASMMSEPKQATQSNGQNT